MPIPTPQQIEAGFETRTPDPGQAQRLQEIRLNLVAAAQFMAERCNDNRHVITAIKSIQNAYSLARSSILTPADPTP